MFDARKTGMIGLPYGEKPMTICWAVFIQYPLPACHGQTDRQTDGRTELVYQYRASAAGCWLVIKINRCAVVIEIYFMFMILCSKRKLEAKHWFIMEAKQCLASLHTWFCEHGMALNPTEPIQISCHHLRHVSEWQVSTQFCTCKRSWHSHSTVR